MLEPAHANVLAGHLARTIEFVCQHLVKNVVDERRLARATHPRDSHEGAQGKVDGDGAKIVSLRPLDCQHPRVVNGPTLHVVDNLTTTREIIACDRGRVSDQVSVRTGVHDLAAVLARAGTDVDDPIGGSDRVFVVLDHDERIAEAFQLDESVDEASVVALVQADRRLVEHVKNPGESRPDLRREPDALGFAARERSGGTRHAQVAESDLEQELEARADLAQDGRSDGRLALGERDGLHEVVSVEQAQLGHRRDTAAIDRDGEHFGFEPRPVALGARHLAQILRKTLLRPITVGFGVLAFDVRDHALEARGVRDIAPKAIAPFHSHLEVIALQDRLVSALLKLAPRGVE